MVSAIRQKPIRVLIADDHALMRQVIITILAQAPDIEIIGEASNGRQAVLLAKEYQPDVAILDLVMPVVDGIRAAQEICNDTSTQVLLLTMHEASPLAQFALKTGAKGFVAKSTISTDLVDAIRRVYNKQIFMSETILQQCVDELLF